MGCLCPCQTLNDCVHCRGIARSSGSSSTHEASPPADKPLCRATSATVTCTCWCSSPQFSNQSRHAALILSVFSQYICSQLDPAFILSTRSASWWNRPGPFLLYFWSTIPLHLILLYRLVGAKQGRKFEGASISLTLHWLCGSAHGFLMI